CGASSGRWNAPDDSPPGSRISAQAPVVSNGIAPGLPPIQNRPSRGGGEASRLPPAGGSGGSRGRSAVDGSALQRTSHGAVLAGGSSPPACARTGPAAATHSVASAAGISHNGRGVIPATP